MRLLLYSSRSDVPDFSECISALFGFEGPPAHEAGTAALIEAQEYCIRFHGFQLKRSSHPGRHVILGESLASTTART